jgi:LysM repeat protein
MIEIFKKLGRWNGDKTMMPEIGDVIYYDWQNDGTPSHVGYVAKISGQELTVIEGNKSTVIEEEESTWVGERIIAIGHKDIFGYGKPDYAGKPSAEQSQAEASTPPHPLQTEASSTTNETALRQAVISKAYEFIGYNEEDGSYKKIFDIYNKYQADRNGYQQPSNAAWCAIYVSTISILMDLTDIIPVNAKCTYMVELFKKLGRWNGDRTVTPEVGDVIYYDKDKKGEPSHVGYVAKVSGKELTAIEGNKSDRVAERIIAIGDEEIFGYGKPDYASKAAKIGKLSTADTGTGNSQTTTDTTTSSGENAAVTGNRSAGTEQTGGESPRTYTVKKGDTLSWIATEFGMTYQQLARHNAIEDPNLILIGQVIEIPVMKAIELVTESVG